MIDTEFKSLLIAEPMNSDPRRAVYLPINSIAC